jgi:uncharacterized protein YkwD
MHFLSWLIMCWSFFGWGQPPAALVQHHQHHGTRQVFASPSPTPAPAPSSPSPSPAAAPAASDIASEAVCPGQSDSANTVAALTCLTNNARTFHHLQPVNRNQALLAAAAAKDADMAHCGYGHEACGHPFDYQIKASGYPGRCYGENIAMGQQSPREVFTVWMNSPGHRANILNSQYRDLGVAEVSGQQGPLWVMELGGC